jgi:hypothetical protein
MPIPWTPPIPRNCARSDPADAAGPGPPRDAAWDVEPGGCWPATWSVSTFASVALPHRVRFLAFCVVIATMATVVMNRASTRPSRVSGTLITERIL